MPSKKITLFLLLFFIIIGFPSLKAQSKITVYPSEYPNGLNNPLKGFRPNPGSQNDSKDYPYTTIVRDYIRWNQIENSAGDGVQKIIDFCNARWAKFESMNIKVIPRIYIDWDNNAGNEYWPADLTSGDWTSQEFKDRVVKLIYKLGEAWDNDPRVAWVQTGIIGYWGEQESPVGVGSDGWAKRLGDAYTFAFKNKKLLVRNQDAWPGYEMGVYWDSYGHPGQRSGSWTNINNFNAQRRYLDQVIEGEVAYNWGETSFDPLYGGEPTITLGNNQYTDNMIDVIRELHCTGLGWISDYKIDGSFGTDPAIVKANASRIQKEFGYRFVIPEFSCSSRADQGGALDINFKVKNMGSAPFYQNWPVAFVLINESTKQIVWKKQIDSIDIRNWLPGDKYSYTSRTYQVPAKEYVINSTLTIPDTLATGQYMAGLTILEPYSQSPGIFFAMKNFLVESQTQPLCRIGIGQDLTGDYNISPSLFGDPVLGDKRYYSLTPQGKTYTLSHDTPNGSLKLKPAGGSYLPGTVVTVTAIGNTGFGFESWGGDLSGTQNSITITMDSDKMVSATFTPVPTHNLTINTKYGSVVLDPPGGIYNEGTVVSLMPSPVFGYEFGEWTGDVTGTAIPATITMDADKNVGARFIYSGGGTFAFATNCGGPKYNSSDGSVYSADIYNSGGNTYSTTSPISGTPDGQIYQTERFGSTFGYHIPLSNGEYEVTLMFAEIYATQAGSRVFNVLIEGDEVISKLDIYAKVGKNAAYNEKHTVTVSDGILDIEFNTITDNAKISAIRVSSTFQGETFSLTTDALNGAINKNPNITAFPGGSNVILTATPDLGYRFLGWSGDLNGTENPATIYMDGNKSVSASFIEAPWHTLTANAINGSITMSPEGGSYAEGTQVTLTAMPDEGYYFDGWGGDLEGTLTAVATINMDSDKTVSAHFTLIPLFTLTTNITNGSVIMVPSGGKYKNGTVVTIQAIPYTGFEFKGWSGDLIGSVNPTSITMNGDKVVTAQIAEIMKYSLIVDASNGFVTRIPDKELYDPGTAVIIVASPYEGYEFVQWNGDLTGSENPTSIIMDSNKNITANFTRLNTSVNLKNTLSETKLLQNYPNPFTLETTIPYQLKEATHVRISVYNIFDQKVTNLLNEYQSPGLYNIVWNPDKNEGIRQTRGLYFYRLETDNGQIYIRKAILE